MKRRKYEWTKYARNFAIVDHPSHVIIATVAEFSIARQTATSSKVDSREIHH